MNLLIGIVIGLTLGCLVMTLCQAASHNWDDEDDPDKGGDK